MFLPITLPAQKEHKYLDHALPEAWQENDSDFQQTLPVECQMFSHYEPIFDKSGKAVIDSKTGKQKQKHVYGLFTCDEPEQSDKQTAEVMAVQFDMYPLKMK